MTEEILSSSIRRHPNAFKSAAQDQSRAASVPSPLAGSEASEARSRGQGGGSTSRAGSRVHNPHLDEVHGPESLPYRPDRPTPRKPSPDDADPSSESRIFQPTSSREAALGRSTGGKPGHRGGWKKR
jgi:excinuclease ABC subunit B